MSLGRVAMALAVAVSLLWSASAGAAGGDPQAMMNKINAARTKRGLPALRHHAGLSRSAKRYARHLMRTDTFGHADRIRASDRFRRLGELLGRHRGRRPRPGRTVRGWLRSRWHRPLLLSRGFRFAGAGRVYGRFRGRRCTIWVVQLGAR